MAASDRNNPKDLIDAAERGDVKRAKSLIDDGYDVNGRGYFVSRGLWSNSTALHTASGRGHAVVAKLLIKHGADVSAKDGRNSTALHAASGEGHADVAEVLIKHGADVNAKDWVKLTPLHHAASNGKEATTRLLLQSKAVIDAQNNDGRTPLHYSAANGKYVTTKLLLEYNASFEVQDRDGLTPLDFAEGRRVKSLLKAAKKKAEFSVLMQEPGITRNSSRLSVCGYGGVGKTTLVKALQRGFLEAYFTRRSEEKAPSEDEATHIPTPGIDVNLVNIPKAGNYIVWDFAGQPEYYVTHNMFLRANDTVFINVFKVMDVIDGFDGTLTEKMLTWPRFIKSRRSDDQSSDNKPTVILVASGADHVTESRRHRAIKIVEDIRTEIQNMFGKYLNIVDETYLLNCHDSRHKDITRLRKSLTNAKREEKIPKLCAKIADSKNKWQINEKFPILYWHAYVEQVKEIDPLVEEDFLKTATSYLDNIGELLFIKNPNGDDIIVLNIQWLCSRVFGPMLATDIFLQYNKKLRMNKRFYSRSDIDEVFSEFADTELLLNLLKIFELVFEADNSPSVPDGDVQFIAPALLVENMPESQWGKDSLKQIYFGRRIQCRDETDSFSPGLFPRLQARLYNHFRDQGQTPSGIWKNGIKVCHVVECLVYMTRGWRAIHICARAKNEKNIGDCYNLLEMVSEQINDVLEICCPGSDIESRVLSARSLRLHVDPDKVKSYPMQKIVEAEMKGNNVYDDDCGEEEATTELLCAGYDTTLLRISGYECDVKWMMQDTLKKFTTIMDVKRDVTADYRVMADLMGIPHIEVQGLEGQSKTKEILSKWSEEWAKRRREGGPPTEGYKIYKSTFSNLIKILNNEDVEVARNDIIDMFQRLHVSPGDHSITERVCRD